MDNGPLPDQRSIPSPVWTNDFACERASLTPARLLAACWAWPPGLAVAPLGPGWLATMAGDGALVVFVEAWAHHFYPFQHR